MTPEPYRVPTMSEIRAIPWNGFTVASLFAGTGGSSLGYRMAGFRVLYAAEFVEAARWSYAANASRETVVDERDVREIDGQSLMIRAALAGRGDLDILDGSPPCASFSTAGKRHEKWGKTSRYSDTAQRSDDLFLEFARILREVQPKVFVAENVSGLVKGSAQGYFLQILEALKAAGYVVTCRLLDAQWLGVPQARQRTIFVGVRADLAGRGLAPAHPDPLPYRYSLGEAIEGLPDPERPETFPEPEADIARYAIGKEWAALPVGGSTYYGGRLWRCDPSQPAPTVTATCGVSSAASLAHSSEPRKFSIAELKRICSFPDDFELIGTYAQRAERLGRAVPPLMMRAIAATVRDRILTRVGS